MNKKDSKNKKDWLLKKLKKNKEKKPNKNKSKLKMKKNQSFLTQLNTMKTDQT